MTLEQFEEQMKKDIEAFVAFWCAGRELTPEKYPEDLQLEDWQEQFDAFREVVL